MPVISQRAPAHQPTPAPPREKKKKKKTRSKREEEGAMNPNAAPPHLPSHIICMCRIRNDIHREPVRRESWRTKKKKKKKSRRVGRGKEVCSLATNASRSGSGFSSLHPQEKVKEVINKISHH